MTDMHKEVYQVAVDMQTEFQKLLKPGVTTHELAKRRPIPASELHIKTKEDIRKYRAGWSNHFAGIGIGHDDPPYMDLKYPPVTMQKNMVAAYHAMFWVEGWQGVAVEHTYRITDTDFEILTQWPWKEPVVCGV